MLIPRSITEEIRDSASEYPVITVLGPRQSGKSTLCRMVFPSYPYVSLEDPDIRRIAEEDPRGFLSRFKAPVIFDEIQRVPTLLSYLQGLVDAHRIPGSYILTGSHQLELHQSISQSLAGRSALLTLFPFSMKELESYDYEKDLFEFMFKGFYPGLHENQLNPVRFYRNYLQSYVERDVRLMINIKDLSSFQTFLRLLAGRVGQLVNYSSLAADTGVSTPTIMKWVSLLKASFIVIELPPYMANIRKRLTKSSKIYFTDVGLASFLLDLSNPSQISRDPLRGGLFENFVIMEYFKRLLNKGEIPQLFFYRDSHGNEVDLIQKKGREIKAVEIKSGATFNSSFLKGLKKFMDLDLTEKITPLCIYGGNESMIFQNIQIGSWKMLSELD